MKWRDFNKRLFQPLPKQLGVLVRLTEIALLAIILYIILILVNEFIVNPGQGLLLD